MVSSAHARRVPAQLVVHPTFHEGTRFSVQDLNLEGQGSQLELERGGTVRATLDVHHHCADCGATRNQIIVGLANARRASACIWDGGQRSSGWERRDFVIDVPDEPGVYPVRVRYAQAWSCKKAKGWWRVDRPNGPGPEATIGVIIVSPPRVQLRHSDEIRADIDAAMDKLTRNNNKLHEVVSGRRGRRALNKAAELSDDIARQLERLEDLLGELDVAIGRVEGPDRHHHGPSIHVVLSPRTPLPVPQEQVVVVVEEPPLASMTPSSFSALPTRMKGNAWQEDRIKMIADEMTAGARFDKQQALRLMGLFKWDENKVIVGTKVCTAMVEAGALPAMIATMKWDQSRDALRKATGNQCGPVR